MIGVYQITTKTKVISNFEHGYYRSVIQEVNSEDQYSIHKPEFIIGKNCREYGGSSIEGRREVVKEILRSSSKLPIPTIPHLGIFMFPTASAKNKDCHWIAYHQIQTYEQYKNKTIVYFKDGTSLLVNTSYRIFDNQFKRTSQVIVHFFRPRIFGFDTFFGNIY